MFTDVPSIRLPPPGHGVRIPVAHTNDLTDFGCGLIHQVVPARIAL